MENLNKCKKCGRILNKRVKGNYCSVHRYLSDYYKKARRENKKKNLRLKNDKEDLNITNTKE